MFVLYVLFCVFRNDAKLKNQFVIVGAHYDHIGVHKTTETDSIANGANDNAAGTSAVMAIARYFARKKNKKNVVGAIISFYTMHKLNTKHIG